MLGFAFRSTPEQFARDIAGASALAMNPAQRFALGRGAGAAHIFGTWGKAASTVQMYRDI